jgi:hypothetical protein
MFGCKWSLILCVCDQAQALENAGLRNGMVILVITFILCNLDIYVYIQLYSAAYSERFFPSDQNDHMTITSFPARFLSPRLHTFLANMYTIARP